MHSTAPSALPPKHATTLGTIGGALGNAVTRTRIRTLPSTPTRVLAALNT